MLLCALLFSTLLCSLEVNVSEVSQLNFDRSPDQSLRILYWYIRVDTLSWDSITSSVSRKACQKKCPQMSAESCYDRSCETVPGIDIKNAETFFKMLVELQGEDTIDASTFANACVRMKGAATSIDLQTVMFTTHLMNKDSGKPKHRLTSLNSVAHNWTFLCFCIFRRNRPNIDACFVANNFEPIGFNTFFVLGVCGPTFILGAAKLVEGDFES